MSWPKIIQDRFEAKVEKGPGCWNWTACKDQYGYGMFGFAGRMQRAHRVSYQLYVGEIPNGLWCLHRCDNPTCVNPDHIFLGTSIDNNRDRDNKGRGATGEKQGFAKLTEEDVKTIRTMRSKGIRGNAIAKEYGVTRQAISLVIHYHTWKNV